MARPAALAAIAEQPKEQRPPAKQLETGHEVQAAVEGVPAGDRVEFLGQSYRIADRIGLMPLIRFAHAARKGTQSNDIEGLAAIYDMLTDCFTVAPPCEQCEKCTADPPRPDDCPQFDPGDWPRFQEDATRKKASEDDLLGVVSQTIELLTARPTRRPSDSSDGPSPTSRNSTGSSPLPVTVDGSGDKLVHVEELWKKAGA